MCTKVIIDWSKLKNEKSFYTSLFEQTKAPDWHGSNLDAVNDSMVTGDICALGPPFNFEIKNSRSISPELLNFTNSIEEIFQDSVEKNGGKYEQR